MDYSLNEYEALAFKAARGAGLAWGIAEEAGKAVRTLSSLGLESASILRECLENPQKNGALFLGAQLCDTPDGLSQITFSEPVHTPGILLAFVALCSSTSDQCYCCKWEKFEVYIENCELSAVSLEGFNALTAASFSIEVTKTPKGQKQVALDRAVISDHDYEKLNALAFKTYAPSTEASRIAGAGAGLNDND